jgi:hypothetical protein
MTDTDHVTNAFNRLVEEVQDFGVPTLDDYMPIEKHELRQDVYSLRFACWTVGPKTFDRARSILSDFQMELTRWIAYPVNQHEMLVKLVIILH